ncbi:MAG TPA: alpha-ketoacid dehydrogenase subunit beta [Nitrospinota bacterium]|jgi:pyruvate dehydrogenase E1 component beta subunit|nr:alpha-ketoacid dehydrogenase subunit beta [Nitrospinota bacterium]HJN02040.1 alpha-ketoacid dehydrogenase subunit beta [Nitrospinota bacterium]
MAVHNIIESVNLALKEEMKRDDRVIVLGEDVGVNGGVFRATIGLLEEFGDNRVIDTPLSENGIVAGALGMAVNGLRPVAEIQFMGFVYYILNHIICHAARLRNRTRGRITAPLVIRVPYGAGIRAPEHHSESTEALFTQIPGIKVVVPSTPKDTKGLLTSAIRDPDTVIFLEPKRIYRAIKEDIPEEEYTIPLGKARMVKEGKDITVICWGAMVRVVETVSEEAEKENIDIEIIDLRTLSPLDKDTIITSVEKTGRALVVHEAPKTCGLGAEIVALINEKALLSLNAPVLRVTGQDIAVPLAKGEDYYIPSVDRILQGLKKIINF